jgi:hypothetical protein
VEELRETARILGEVQESVFEHGSSIYETGMLASHPAVVYSFCDMEFPIR